MLTEFDRKTKKLNSTSPPPDGAHPADVTAAVANPIPARVIPVPDEGIITLGSVHFRIPGTVSACFFSSTIDYLAIMPF